MNRRHFTCLASDITVLTGFALPGDVSLTLNMTNVILNEVKNSRNKGRSGLYGR